MNETDVVFSMAKILNIEFGKAKKYYDALIESMTEELVNYGRIKFVDFGVFEVADRAPKKGFNPYYRKSVDIPACKEPVFKPGKNLKNLIKES